jgi:hypothetical protein
VRVRPNPRTLDGQRRANEKIEIPLFSISSLKGRSPCLRHRLLRRRDHPPVPPIAPIRRFVIALDEPLQKIFSVHIFRQYICLRVLADYPTTAAGMFIAQLMSKEVPHAREKKLSSEQKKRNAEGNLPARNLASLCAKKFITSEKVNTVPDQPSRRSRLVFQRHVVPASIYRRPRRVEFRKKPGAVPPAPMIKVGAATPRRLCADREPENERSSARDAARRQKRHSPSKRAPQHDTAQEPRDRLQPDKLREQKADGDVP